jgi:hypothetical protein
LGAAVAGNAFHLLFHAAIGPNQESDGALGHPGQQTGWRMLAALSRC